jgi:hypothetical protein
MNHHSEKRHFWQRHIDSYKSSPLSIRAYCVKEGLNWHTFGYWLGKLGERKPQKKSQRGKARFLPIVVSTPPQTKPAVRKSSGLPDPKWVAEFLKSFLEQTDESYF